MAQARPSSPLKAYQKSDELGYDEIHLSKVDIVSTAVGTVWGLFKKGASATSRSILSKSPLSKKNLDSTTQAFDTDEESENNVCETITPERPPLPPRPRIPDFVPAVDSSNPVESSAKPRIDYQRPQTPHEHRLSGEVMRSRFRQSLSPSPGHTPKILNSPTSITVQTTTRSPQSDTSAGHDDSPSAERPGKRATLRKSISLRSLKGSIRASLPMSLQMTGKSDRSSAKNRDSLPKDPADMDDDLDDDSLYNVSPTRHSTPIDIPAPLPAVLQSIGNEFSASVLGEINKMEAEATPDPFMMAQSVNLTIGPNPPPANTFQFKVPLERATILDRPDLYRVCSDKPMVDTHRVKSSAITSPAPDERFYIEDAPDAFGDLPSPSSVYDWTPDHDDCLPVDGCARKHTTSSSIAAASEHHIPRRYRNHPHRNAVDLQDLGKRLARLRCDDDEIAVAITKASPSLRRRGKKEKRSRRDSAVGSLGHVYVNHSMND